MALLRTVMMLVGALAVLTLGAVPASAMGDDAGAPPCHEATASHGGAGEQPSPAAPDKMKTMACCVSCVVTPALQPPTRAEIGWPAPAVSPGLASRLTGLSPSPEHGPPRV